ncbi:MAG: RidA family protein [Rhizobiaceae bacterium]|nr:RidA family protein [Rhizobiaceae bacterium]
MKRKKINASNAPAVAGGYSQAVDISSFERLVFVSGQIPETSEGELPVTFKAQARQVWENIEAQLNACELTKDDIVKVTIFLSERKYALENREVRDEFLGDLSPALTVIITGIFDENWLLEIEAIAAH